MTESATDAANRSTGAEISPTRGAKMQYLIKRRANVTHDELAVHWFANHMPNVIRAQEQQASSGRLHARRYHATLFGADRHGAHPWDGMAQLWFDRPLPAPEVAHGTIPVDSFQQRAEPYVPWATTEYVVIHGDDRIPIEPLTLNQPFPTTRSGFHKVTFLVAARSNVDLGAFLTHWLEVHAANVADVMATVDGFRYVISHSIDPAAERFAGMAELYFPDEAAWAEFQSTIRPDGMEQWVDGGATVILRSNMEMIGIP